LTPPCYQLRAAGNGGSFLCFARICRHLTLATMSEALHSRLLDSRLRAGDAASRV
jgi:hypothetical protein